MRRLRVEIRHAAIMFGYWIKPYDAHLDDRRWRWQESGCSRSRRWWRTTLTKHPEIMDALRQKGR